MSSFYIARQPILDKSGETYGYELLFRSTASNSYDPSIDGDAATARVLINTMLEAGLQSLVGDTLAFVNCTNRYLENPELLELLPEKKCVLEILETVEVTDELVAGVSALRDRGHLIALDDFVDKKRFERLMPLAHIVKYDITQHTMESLIHHREMDAAAGRRSLVERVETHEEFEQLSAAGFDYFQGYYFAQPKVISGSSLAPNKLMLMQLLARINDPGTSIDELADSVSRDVSLGLRTLKYVNSPVTGLSATVTSIQHATILLGRETIRNWVSLLIMTDLDDKPAALIKMALTRARFCQLVAQEQHLGDEAMYFTIGLLSLLDVLMDTTLEHALSSVSIDEEMARQLLQRKGIAGDMLNTVEALEHATTNLSDEFAIDNAGQFFQCATQWTEQTYGLF